MTAMQQALQGVGLNPEEMRRRLAQKAYAQLKRSNIRPSTAVKWHRIGAENGLGKMLRERRHEHRTA